MRCRLDGRYFSLYGLVTSEDQCRMTMLKPLPGMTVGLGVHYDTVDMPYDQYLTESLIHLFDAEIFYTMVAALAKLSILSFYWRIFGRSSIRLPIKIVYGLVVGWIIGRVCQLLTTHRWPHAEVLDLRHHIPLHSGGMLLEEMRKCQMRRQGP